MTVSKQSKLKVTDDEALEIEKYCHKTGGMKTIDDFHKSTRNAFRKYNGTSVANIFKNANKTILSGKLPKRMAAIEAGKRQAEDADLDQSAALSSALMKKAKSGANL